MNPKYEYRNSSLAMLGSVPQAGSRFRNKFKIRMFQCSKQNQSNFKDTKPGFGHLNFCHSILFRISDFDIIF